MSHGEEGKILGSDEGWISVKTLTSLMTSDLCPSLRDKPKFFFLQVMATCKKKKKKIAFSLLTILLLVWFHIQSCRGKDFDPGVEADGEEAAGEFVGISDVPEADFLCCYSTVEGLHFTDSIVDWFYWILYTHAFDNRLISLQVITHGEIQKKALYLSVNFARCCVTVILRLFRFSQELTVTWLFTSSLTPHTRTRIWRDKCRAWPPDWPRIFTFM